MVHDKIVWRNAFSIVDPDINSEGVHVWPFDPALPVDVNFLLIGGRQQIRLNRHDYFEIIYVNSGGVRFQVQERVLRASKGDLIVVGSGLYHAVLNKPRDWISVVAMFFKAPAVGAAESFGEDRRYLTPFLAQGPDFPHVVSRRSGAPAEVLEHLQRIHREMPARDEVARLAVRTHLKMILLLLVRHYASYSGAVETNQRRLEAIERLQPLFRHIRDHYNEEIHIAHAARLCAMSESHFMSFFKQVTGESFLSYLNKCRVERAAALLTTTRKSIAAVGQEAGFCDQSHFGAVFRKIAGMTPRAWRTQYGAGAAPPSPPAVPTSPFAVPARKQAG